MRSALRNALVAVGTLLLLVCCLVGFGVQERRSASAEGEVTVTYNEYEAVLFGEPVEIIAQVTRDGVTAPERIRYTDFAYDNLNVLFSCFDVRGYIEGWSEEIVQHIVVVPNDIEYFINCGVNVTDKEYSNGSEGVLGLELDHTGASGEDNGYFQAVLRRFPALRNRTANKQFGVSDDAYGEWGYVGDQQITQLQTQQNIFTTVMFPKRGTTSVEYRLTIPNGEYDLHLGLYNLWFARTVVLSVNGTVMEEALEIRPMRDTRKYTAVVTDGTLTLSLTGPAVFDEAMLSFLFVTAHDATQYTVPAAPVVAPTIELEDDSVLVSSLETGAKLQMFDTRTKCIIYEGMIDAQEMRIPFSDFYTDDIVGIGILQVNALYASPAVYTYRSDILDMNVSYDATYTAEPVLVEMSARAASGIVRLDIFKDGTLLERRTYEEEVEWKDTIVTHENGSYTYTLYSGANAFLSEQREIGNIDSQAPTLTLTLNAASAGVVSEGVRLQLDYTTIAPVTRIESTVSGTAQPLEPQDAFVSFATSGRYTVSMHNAVGKTVSRSLIVSLDDGAAQTVTVKREQVSGATRITFESKAGYAFSEALVYMQEDGGGQRLIVNGNSFNAYDDGVYLVQVNNADGTVEYLRMTVGDEGDQPQGGLSFAAKASIAFGVSIPVCIAVAVVAYVLLKKKLRGKNA